MWVVTIYCEFSLPCLTIGWIRCCVSFSLLRASVVSIIEEPDPISHDFYIRKGRLVMSWMIEIMCIYSHNIIIVSKIMVLKHWTCSWRLLAWSTILFSFVKYPLSSWAIKLLIMLKKILSNISLRLRHMWPAMKKRIKIQFPVAAMEVAIKSKFLNFLFISPSEYSSFQLYFDTLSQNICVISVIVMRCNLFFRFVLFSGNWNYEPKYPKLIITRPVVILFSWNFHHCIVHRNCYPSIQKAQHWWKILNGI